MILFTFDGPVADGQGFAGPLIRDDRHVGCGRTRQRLLRVLQREFADEGRTGEDDFSVGGAQTRDHVQKGIGVVNVGHAHQAGVMERRVERGQAQVVRLQRVKVDEFVEHFEVVAFNEAFGIGRNAEEDEEIVGRFVIFLFIQKKVNEVLKLLEAVVALHGLFGDGLGRRFIG